MNDYGHIDDETPSFAMSLYEKYRHLGIGTALMGAMMQFLREIVARTPAVYAVI